MGIVESYCKKKPHPQQTFSETTNETNEQENSSSKLFGEGKTSTKAYSLKNKLIKKKPNEEEKNKENKIYEFQKDLVDSDDLENINKENKIYEFQKDLVDSDDLENIFKIGIDHHILQFYDKVLDEKTNVYQNFLRNFESREFEEEEEEKNVLSPFENEEENEQKKKELLLVEIEKAEEERDGIVFKNDEKINQILECAQETHDDYHFSKHNLINDHKEYEPDAFNYDKNCNELIQEKNDSKERENNKEKENELDQKPKSPNSESIIIELKSENSEAIHQSEKEENIHKALPAVNFPKDTSFEDKNHNYNGNNDENFHEFNWIGDAENVWLGGSWDHWVSRIKLEKDESGMSFHCKIPISKGRKYYYKFCINSITGYEDGPDGILDLINS